MKPTRHTPEHARLDVGAATAAVSRADPMMAQFIARNGPYAPRERVGDHFASLVRAICYQQLAGKAAAAIHRRLVAALRDRVTPAAFLAVEPSVLRAAGLSSAKTAALLDLAAKAADGTLPLAGIDLLDDDEIIERLSGVRGIGRWTAEMFLLFELERPDVWPVDDYGVRNGWSLIYALPEMITARGLRAEGERFRPHRSFVALYCWHAVHLARGQVGGGEGRPEMGQPSDTDGPRLTSAL
jgi:DNA-3-methyladenine glycosylase II